jgi:hypothetical protein
MSAQELGEQDIAVVNLSCAVDLPCVEKLDISACITKLDDWTDLVRLGTRNALRDWDRFPEYQGWSEPLYRSLTLLVVLQKHLGLTYDFAFNEDPYDGRDSRHHFIHGILLDGFPAVCVTAPVLYAAIGRRMGYPIKIVKAQEHLFCRWEDGSGECFNIEATSPGFWSHPNEYYHTWPKPIRFEAVERGILLKSLSPNEELALFLAERGSCYMENLQPAEALKPLYQSCRIDPVDYFHRNRWKIATVMYRALRAAQANEDVPQIPSPQTPWEASVYGASSRYLERVLSNRQSPLRTA